MKIYVGSRDYKPDGYLTLDIDEKNSPDIIGDITNLSTVESGTVDEIIASHVLEHIEWPDNFLAISELSRVLRVGGLLKIAVPDMAALIRMLLRGESEFHVIGLMYGVGGRYNTFEQHRYGFTPGMLIDILEFLGFSDFDWFNSTIRDASNGWIPMLDGKHVGMSLNIVGIKKASPLIESKIVYKKLLEHPLDDFLKVASECYIKNNFNRNTVVPKLYQRIHFQLIEANQRIEYLENEIEKSRNVDI